MRILEYYRNWRKSVFPASKNDLDWRAAEICYRLDQMGKGLQEFALTQSSVDQRALKQAVAFFKNPDEQLHKTRRVLREFIRSAQPANNENVIHSSEVPIPPLQMRQLVGETKKSEYDNLNRSFLFDLPQERFDVVLDFGCGCGRNARKMALQNAQPRVYVGMDLHKGMVKWCNENISSIIPNFIFLHHDVYNEGFNPEGIKAPLPCLPFDDKTFSLIISWSVFTHIIESDAEHYLREIARLLRDDGEMVATFFLFDKRSFPMMQEFQNTLYINVDDPTNATIFDREWLQVTLASLGLIIVDAYAPEVRGYQWRLHIRPSSCGLQSIKLPEDNAEFGRKPPPIVIIDPTIIGI